MKWGVLYRESINTWKLYPDLFDTRDQARFAAEQYPDLLKYRFKRPVSVNVTFPRGQRAFRMPKATSHMERGASV